MSYKQMTPDNVEPTVKSDYNMLMGLAEIVKKFNCPECGILIDFDDEWEQTRHILTHAIGKRVAVLWEEGKTLKEIDDLYHIFHSYNDNVPDCYDSFLECHHNITKDSCFTISYLQCCDHPAYRITEVTPDGNLTVFGVGGWHGGFGNVVSMGCLRDPRPASELYVYNSEGR